MWIPLHFEQQECNARRARVASLIKSADESLEGFKNIMPVDVDSENSDVTFATTSSQALIFTNMNRSMDRQLEITDSDDFTTQIQTAAQDHPEIAELGTFRNLVNKHFWIVW